MNRLMHRTKLFVNRNGATILTCVSGVGVVVTSVMTVKATLNALPRVEAAKEEKGEELTKLDIVKAAAPAYIPAAVMGASTIACIFGANALNKRKQAALMSAYALLDSSYKEYKRKVIELYGEEADGKVREEIAKDRYEEANVTTESEDPLFYDEFSQRYFNAPTEKVIKAEYEINKKISLWGGAEVNEFYEWLDIPQLDEVKHMGWSTGGLMANTWKDWLDFKHTRVVLDDGLECTIISTWPEPMYDYEYY